MTAEEQLLRDIKDYSKNPHNKYIVDRAKRELAELQHKNIMSGTVVDVKEELKKLEVPKKFKLKKK